MPDVFLSCCWKNFSRVWSLNDWLKVSICFLCQQNGHGRLLLGFYYTLLLTSSPQFTCCLAINNFANVAMSCTYLV